MQPLADAVRREQERLDSATSAKERKRASKALGHAQLELLVVYSYLRARQEVPTLAAEFNLTWRRTKGIVEKMETYIRKETRPRPQPG